MGVRAGIGTTTLGPARKYRLAELWNQTPGAPGMPNVVANGPLQLNSIEFLIVSFGTDLVLISVSIAGVTISTSWALSSFERKCR